MCHCHGRRTGENVLPGVPAASGRQVTGQRSFWRWRGKWKKAKGSNEDGPLETHQIRIETPASGKVVSRGCARWRKSGGRWRRHWITATFHGGSPCRQGAELAGVAYWHDPAVKIGAWEPAQPRAITNTLEWAVPPGILAPGKYRLSLNHLKGRNGLKISGAELLEDGQEVARDGHDGLAGAGYN